METYGAPSRRQERRGEDPNRPRILDVGYAGYGDEPGSVAAYNTNPETGSLAVATGTGSDTGVETAVRGFGYAMWSRQTQHAKTIAKALNLVRSSMDALPEAISRARAYREEQEHSLGAVTGVQLFDNKLLINGRHPVFVYDLQTADCTWPNRGGAGSSSVEGSNIHILNRGQHIVIMNPGRTSNEGIGTRKIRAALQHILANPPGDQQLTAQIIADELHTMLATDDSQGAMLVSIIDLEPWEDQRPFWKKLGDYTLRIPSTALYGLAAFAVDKKRRQLYETRTTAGRLGRGLAIAGDLALNVGFLAFAYSMARSTMGAAEEAGGLLALGAGTAPGGTATPPANIPPAEQPPHIIEAYSDSRVATGHDPLSHGQESTVSNWSQDILRHYGEQEGLPQAEIDKLARDGTTVTEVNRAFYNDAANPNNEKVAEDPQHWLNAGDQYSQVDQSEAAHQIVLETKHSLGLDVPPPPVPEPAEVPAPAPPPALAAAPVPTPTELQSLKLFLATNWGEIAAASGGTSLLAVGAAARHRRNLRKKRGELIENINRGTQVTSHNGARRMHNERLLASARLPRRSLDSALPVTAVSMLDDDETVPEITGVPDQSVPALPASRTFDEHWDRFSEIT